MIRDALDRPMGRFLICTSGGDRINFVCPQSRVEHENAIRINEQKFCCRLVLSEAIAPVSLKEKTQQQPNANPFLWQNSFKKFVGQSEHRLEHRLAINRRMANGIAVASLSHLWAIEITVIPIYIGSV